MWATIVQGNLLNANETFICHQCNCMSLSGAGLYTQIAKKFPYADIYKERTEKINIFSALTKRFPDSQSPGNLLIRGNGKDQRYVISILGQVKPGAPSASFDKTDYPDNELARLNYFNNALSEMTKIQKYVENLPENVSFAFPWKIGCGLAGGNWEYYKRKIDAFAAIVNGAGWEVKIYKLLD